MRDFSLTAWLAVVFSVLSVLAMVFIWAEYIAASALAGLSGAWYLAYRNLSRSTSQLEEHPAVTPAEDAVLSVEMSQALSELNTTFQQKITQNSDDLTQLKDVLHDAINNLNESFATLNELGQEQKNIVLSVIDNGEEEQTSSTRALTYGSSVQQFQKPWNFLSVLLSM